MASQRPSAGQEALFSPVCLLDPVARKDSNYYLLFQLDTKRSITIGVGWRQIELCLSLFSTSDLHGYSTSRCLPYYYDCTKPSEQEALQ